MVVAETLLIVFVAWTSAKIGAGTYLYVRYGSIDICANKPEIDEDDDDPAKQGGATEGAKGGEGGEGGGDAGGEASTARMGSRVRVRMMGRGPLQ